MTTNPLFSDHFGSEVEQELLNDLIVESIQIHGQDMLYVPKRTYSRDGIFTEDVSQYYDTHYTIECYLKNAEGFQGMGNVMSMLGTQLRDQITLQVSMTRFEEEVLAHEEEWEARRPREHDLVWFPLQQKMFEITFVDKFQMLYPLGRLYVWELTCELYEYSSEKFMTGLPEIDDHYNVLSQDVLDYAVKDEQDRPVLDTDGEYIMGENFLDGDLDPEDQSNEIEQEADQIIDFSESDPFSEGENY